MTEQEYNRIRRKVDDANGDFAMTNQPSVYSGYRSLSMEKVAAVGHLLISKIGSTFVTKMNKLMFYADFIHYKRHGYGITGLSYRALQYGPVPGVMGHCVWNYVRYLNGGICLSERTERHTA